jgi:hypothetical protein
MAYNPCAYHGFADQNSFWELPKSDVPALTALEESTNASTADKNGRRFAHLVYQVNPTPVNMSGDVIIDTDHLEMINADGFSTLSGQLDDLCTKANSGLIEPALSISVECSGNYTWMAEALPGTPIASSAWRVKQIEDVTVGGYQTIRILWADGDGNFDNSATPPLSGLTYL